MKTLLTITTFITGGFLAYGIGKMIYWLRRGPSLFVGGTPIILAFAIMAATQSGGNFKDMSITQALAAGLSLGLASCGAFLFWSQKSWGL